MQNNSKKKILEANFLLATTLSLTVLSTSLAYFVPSGAFGNHQDYIHLDIPDSYAPNPEEYEQYQNMNFDQEKMYKAQEFMEKSKSYANTLNQISEEIAHLKSEIKDNEEDIEENDKRIDRMTDLKAELLEIQSEIDNNSHLIDSIPDEMSIDLSQIETVEKKINEGILKIDNEVENYQSKRQKALEKANRAKELAENMQNIKLRAQNLKEDVFNNPLDEKMEDKLNNLVTEIAENKNTANTLLKENDDQELRTKLDKLKSEKQSLVKRAQTLNSFRKIVENAQNLQEEAQNLQEEAQNYVEPEDFLEEDLDPWQRYNILQEKANIQKTYLEERISLMDSRSPGYEMANEGLEKFITIIEQAHVDMGVPPHREEMEIFLEIRELGGKLLELSNFAYSLVSKEAQDYIDVKELKLESEKIDRNYRNLSWQYFEDGSIDKDYVKESLENLREKYTKFNSVIENISKTLSNPEDPKLLADLALSWNTKGDINAAIRNSKEAFEMDRQNPFTNFAYGKSLLSDNSIEDALDLFEKASNLDPQMIEAYFGLSDAYSEINDIDSALEAVERGLSLNPRAVELYERAGAVYKDMGLEELIKVYVDGSMPKFDVLPEIINGRTMLPVRAISEAFGAEVGWDAENGIVILEIENNKIRLPVGENYAYRNDELVALDMSATIIDGRTLVPVRFLAESLGADVEWMGDFRMVTVNRK